MVDWLTAAGMLLLAACAADRSAPPGEATRIRCEVTHPAVAVAIDRLRAVLGDTPFSALHYDAALLPPQAAGHLGPEGFEVKPVAAQGRRVLEVRAGTPVGLAYGIMRLVRIGLSAPARLGSLALRVVPGMPLREALIADLRLSQKPSLAP